jgi:hypothetical protein
MSTTYIRLIVQAIVALANVVGIDLDEGFLFEALSVVIIAGVSLWELHNRYQLGGIKWFGKRK